MFSVTNPLSSLLCSCKYKSSVHITHIFSQKTFSGVNVKSITGNGELWWCFLFGPTQLLFFIPKKYAFKKYYEIMLLNVYMDRMHSSLHPHRKGTLTNESVAHYLLPSSGNMSTSSLKSWDMGTQEKKIERYEETLDYLKVLIRLKWPDFSRFLYKCAIFHYLFANTPG